MSSKLSPISKYLFLLVLAAATLAPLGFLYAQTAPPPMAATRTYTELAPLPRPPLGSGIITDTDTGLTNFLKTFFWLAIVSAGVLAVLMITKGGILYMTSEAFNTKGEAKTQITMAIVGFLLAISSVLILTTINPELLNFKLLVRPLTFTLPPPPTAGAGSIPGCTTNASAPLIRCDWALSGGTCSVAIMGAYNNWVDLADNYCTGDKLAAYRCCGFVPLKNGCTGIGVYAGKTECAWVGDTGDLGNLCINAPFATSHPGFQRDTSELFCSGTKPGASILGSGSNCCVK